MNTSSAPLNRHAFSLIEMLVVIAIIATLAGLIFPAIGSSLKTAKMNKAVAEAQSISGAVDLFFKDYGYMPVDAADQGYGASDGPEFTASGAAEIIQVLMGENADLNPKNTRYLDADSPIVDGEYLDPWGEAYRMKLDLNYDYKIEISGGGILITKGQLYCLLVLMVF